MLESREKLEKNVVNTNADNLPTIKKQTVKSLATVYKILE